MTAAEVEAELSVRLYRWAILDAQREVNQDYPFVRSIKNYRTNNYLQYVEQLSYEERIKLAVSLVKRVHSVAVKHLGEVLTEDDNKANLPYQQFSKTTYPEYLNALRTRKCETCVLIDKTKFFKRIINELEVAFGCQVKKTDQFSCSITVPIGSWFLKTTVELLSKTEGWPRYNQYISKNATDSIDLAPQPSHQVTNMLFWMGIWGETVWDTPFEADAEAAMKSLIFVCQHYKNSLPDVLQGLKPSDFDIKAKIAEWKQWQH